MSSPGDQGTAGAGAAPGPDHPERVALPWHLRSAAAALFDGLGPPLPAPVVDRAVARLEAGAARLAAGLTPGAEITVDAFGVRTVAGCPAAVVEKSERPFAWTPATAARTIGLRAVAYHLRGDAPSGPGPVGVPVEVAVEVVVAELIRAGKERTPGPWLAGLGPPGRAVAVAQARRWAEQALAWLPLRLVGRRHLRLLDDDWWPPGTGRSLVVHGRRDVTIDVAGARVAVTVAGGTASGPGVAEVDALTALAGLLGDRRGRLARVVRVHPASGEVVAVDVTAALVERGVEVVLATATVLAEVEAGVEPPAVPGPGCTWCHRRDGCGPGVAWLDRPDRRAMGLPLLASRV